WSRSPDLVICPSQPPKVTLTWSPSVGPSPKLSSALCTPSHWPAPIPSSCCSTQGLQILQAQLDYMKVCIKNIGSKKMVTVRPNDTWSSPWPSCASWFSWEGPCLICSSVFCPELCI
uniref:Uncharacterized protein n=1 Tax=Piliocolobus tephrosceles TaxID=591936 RepID=A0A8C9IIB9_9PRIM